MRKRGMDGKRRNGRLYAMMQNENVAIKQMFTKPETVNGNVKSTVAMSTDSLCGIDWVMSHLSIFLNFKMIDFSKN